MSQELFAYAPDTPPTTAANTAHAKNSTESHVQYTESWLRRLLKAFAALRARRQATRDLLYLREEAPSHILNDVGLTREQIDRELHRLRRETFW